VSVTGIVLAGGAASRFGGPKLAAEVDGTSILALAIASVASMAAEVLVAGPELPGDLALRPGSVRLVPDREPRAGPFSALTDALRQAAGDRAIVVGGDMPRLVPSVLRAMLARLDVDPASEAVLLDAPGDAAGRRQVLPVALRIGVASRAAADARAAGDRSLRAFLDRLACSTIPLDTWLELDPAGTTLLDVDTPADLERLRTHDVRTDPP
jgi:molybdopterin-guanine dinucleotide biosynthesis protein A